MSTDHNYKETAELLDRPEGTGQLDALMKPSRVGAIAAASFTLALFVAGASAAHAQDDSLTVDPDLAKRGGSLFTGKGCNACHTIGKGKLVGPDLAGVTERRPLDWLRRFIADPLGMMETDSIAQALLADYGGIKMPGLRLKEQEIEALLHYLEQENAKRAGGS